MADTFNFKVDISPIEIKTSYYLQLPIANVLLLWKDYFYFKGLLFFH